MHCWWPASSKAIVFFQPVPTLAAEGQAVVISLGAAGMLISKHIISVACMPLTTGSNAVCRPAMTPVAECSGCCSAGQCNPAVLRLYEQASQLRVSKTYSICSCAHHDAVLAAASSRANNGATCGYQPRQAQVSKHRTVGMLGVLKDL